MLCPFCNQSFPLTWWRYFDEPTGKHVCPDCGRTSKFKFSYSYVIILSIVNFGAWALQFMLTVSLFGFRWMQVITGPYLATFYIIGLVITIAFDIFYSEKFRRLEGLESSSAEADPNRRWLVAARRVRSFAIAAFGCFPAFVVISIDVFGPHWVGQIACSPTGNLIAGDCGTDGVWIWRKGRIWTARQRLSLEDRIYRDIQKDTFQFSDENTLAYVRSPPAGSMEYPAVVYWDVNLDRIVRVTSFPHWPIFFAIAPAADVAVIAPRSSDSIELGEEWIILDLKSGQQVGAIPIGFGLKNGFASQIALSRNGERLAANIYQAGWKTEIWDLDTQTRVFQSDTHSFSSMSADGSIVALDSSMSFDHQFWNLNDNQLICETKAPLGYVHVFPDGTKFLADSHFLEIWEIGQTEPLSKLVSRSDFYTAHHGMSLDGSTIAASAGQRIFSWNAASFKRTTIK